MRTALSTSILVLSILFYALLAIIAGSAIVAIGGGGIGPMRAQWEKALGRIQRDAPQFHLRQTTVSPQAEAVRRPGGEHSLSE